MYRENYPTHDFTICRICTIGLKKKTVKSDVACYREFTVLHSQFIQELHIQTRQCPEQQLYL